MGIDWIVCENIRKRGESGDWREGAKVGESGEGGAVPAFGDKIRFLKSFNTLLCCENIHKLRGGDCRICHNANGGAE